MSQKVFSEASYGPLCNLTIGFCIFVLTPMLLGIVHGPAVAGAFPIIFCAYPIMVIAVVKMIKQGDLIGGTTNAVCGAVVMGQNGFVALMHLIYSATGKEMPPEVALGNAWFSGFAFVVVGLILFYLTFLLLKVNKATAVCIGIGAVGMFAFGVYFFLNIVGNPIMIVGLIGANGLFVLAGHMIYEALKSYLPSGE